MPYFQLFGLLNPHHFMKFEAMISRFIFFSVLLFFQYEGLSQSTEAFISADELAEQSQAIFLFDISKPDVYEQEHINGAIHVSRDDISEADGNFHGQIAGGNQIKNLLEKSGISNGDRVVVYDHKGGCDAARFWLVLKCYGFEDVRVFNGGLDAWNDRKATFRTSDGSPGEVQLEDVSSDILANRKDVLKALEQEDFVIVDTRTWDEFTGEKVKDHAKKGGHIPGAVHLDWGNLVDFNNNRQLKSIKDIKYELEQKGVTSDKNIIVYCHTGTRSSHTYMVLKEVLNYPNVKNYDGSWVEWSSDNTLPIEVEEDQSLSDASYGQIFIDSFFGYLNYIMDQITFKSEPWYENYFWFLIALSLIVWLLEILFPWRKDQSIFRKDFWLDFFFMFFNFYIFNLVIFIAFSKFVTKLIFDLTGADITGVSVFDMSGLSWGWQMLIFFLATDFIQWVTHVCLHRFDFLWRFHKVHHSVEEMGFAAHLRYHWMETVFYTPMKFIAVMFIGGFAPEQAFMIYFFNIAVGHLNHANLGWSYGPLKYIFNNPKMHIWHHAKDLPKDRRYGVNFGITLSIWDYIFRKNYIPSSGRDIALGFEGIEKYPKRFFGLITSGFGKTTDEE
jgi:3-mercaptopyruvate sulfurtransferase SseA/sterol desaturase/sphingolipid hydroxylase (fatty acid hydroxylase superfamily)